MCFTLSQWSKKKEKLYNLIPISFGIIYTTFYEQYQKRNKPFAKIALFPNFLDICTLSLVAGQEIHRSREDVWEVPFVSGRIVDTQLAHTLAFFREINFPKNFVKSISRIFSKKCEF